MAHQHSCLQVDAPCVCVRVFDTIEIVATTAGGLEAIAADEIRERFGDLVSNLVHEHKGGKVAFLAPMPVAKLARRLRSIHHLTVVAVRGDGVDGADARALLESAAMAVDMRAPLNALKLVQPQLTHKLESAPKELRFRVTCHRVDVRNPPRHAFRSEQAAAYFGAALSDRFGWVCDLDRAEMDVHLNIRDNAYWVGIRLTDKSLHRRNLASPATTSLMNSIAYCMARVALLRPGDVVLDPLCGGGTVPIEATDSYKGVFALAADSHDKAIEHASKNFANMQRKRHFAPPIDLLQWDSTRMPLRDGSVDVIITDLPFGKRIGTRNSVAAFLPKVLLDMARICRPSTGRAVLLMKNARLVAQLVRQSPYWTIDYDVNVNEGGLRVCIYRLLRTNVLFTPPLPSKRMLEKQRKEAYRKQRALELAQMPADNNELTLSVAALTAEVNASIADFDASRTQSQLELDRLPSADISPIEDALSPFDYELVERPDESVASSTEFIPPHQAASSAAQLELHAESTQPQSTQPPSTQRPPTPDPPAPLPIDDIWVAIETPHADKTIDDATSPAPEIDEGGSDWTTTPEDSD